MRKLLLILVVATGCAPSLGPEARFVSHKASGENAILPIKGREVGSIRFVCEYEVRAPAGEYLVELYVEANGDGSKAKLIDRKALVVPASSSAEGRFDRHELDRMSGLVDHPAGLDDLPHPFIGKGWHYRLVLKRGDTTVADTGVQRAQYSGPK